MTPMDNHGVEGVEARPPPPPPPPSQPPLGDSEEDEDEEYCLEFPPGVRFSPTDEELINSYLMRRVKKKKLPCDDLIHEINLDEYHPMELFEKFPPSSEGCSYFFTPRDRKYAKGSRPDRAAKDGFWKATGADKPILENASGRSIGCKRNLVFCEGNKKQQTKTGWMMVEYCVPESRIKIEPKNNHSNKHPSKQHVSEKGYMLLDTSVLCKIYYKESSRHRKEGSSESVRQGNSAATRSSPAGLPDLAPPPDQSNFIVAPALDSSITMQQLPRDFLNPIPMQDQHNDTSLLQPAPGLSNFTVASTHDPPSMIQQVQPALMWPNAIQMQRDQLNDAPLWQPTPDQLDFRAVAPEASHALMDFNTTQMLEKGMQYYGLQSVQRDAPSNVHGNFTIPIQRQSNYDYPPQQQPSTFISRMTYPMPTATHSQLPTLPQQEAQPNTVVLNYLRGVCVPGPFIQQPQSNAESSNNSQVPRIEGNRIGPSNMQHGNRTTVALNASRQTINPHQMPLPPTPVMPAAPKSNEHPPSKHGPWPLHGFRRQS